MPGLGKTPGAMRTAFNFNPSMDNNNRNSLRNLVSLSALLLLVRFSTSQLSQPASCSDPERSCSAFLHYLLDQEQSIHRVETAFNAWTRDISVERNTSLFVGKSPNQQSLFIRITCSCSSAEEYGYRVESSSSDSGFDYQGLEFRNGSTSATRWLMCACSSNTYPYLVSHVVQARDTLALLAARFESNVTDIMEVNGIQDSNYLANGVVYYIPVNSAPGSPFAIAPASNGDAEQVDTIVHESKKHRLSMGAAVGIAAAGAVLLTVLLGYLVSRARRHQCDGKYRDSFCCLISRKELLTPRTPRTPMFSREMVSKAANVEKPVVYSYEEVEAATDCFKEGNKLGQGAYGSVFFGVLRQQEVAVKRMKATKSKEFLTEIKILCKVHHANLVELLGYASCEEELLLVYEYAENRSLSDKLHEPLSKGYTPLSWVARVQIALDTARGLEYIHDHAKAHYVHRDVKTSNILLDGNFRAKLADFGLAKLVQQGGDMVTRIVGTFGYLAPEYLRDGHATSKSDVYAFGVVLFELITGQEAISKSKVHVPSTPERRSLISIVFSALRDSTPTNIGRLREVADPLLENTYPGESLHRLAVLGKQCVEEDPLLRPDMKQVVFTLSHVLFNSVEWEATLAGNSQVFSKIMQGR